MTNYKRYSPITFANRSAQTVLKYGWQVVFDYEDRTEEPSLIDLSHIGKWDLQGENLSSIQPCGIPMPKIPGQCVFENGFLVNHLKWNWATIWCLAEDSSESFKEYAYTDVTEAYALLCLVGKDVFAIMEKITALDLHSSEKKSPFMLIGPVVNVRSQVVVLEKADCQPVVLVACARGYGQSIADAMLDAGKEWGLQPAGEIAFSEIVKKKIWV